MVHFKYYKIRTRLGLAWSRPCTDWSQMEPTSIFRATIDPKFHQDRSIFGKMAAEKNLFDV